MPRKAALGEHRNDHQAASARKLSEQGLIEVAWDADELRTRLDDWAGISPPARPPLSASPELVEAVRRFLET